MVGQEIGGPGFQCDVPPSLLYHPVPVKKMFYLHFLFLSLCHNSLSPSSFSLPFDLLIDIRLDGCQSSARLHQRNRSPEGKKPKNRETDTMCRY